MNQTATTIQENAAAAAFSKQAPEFDLLYADNTIIRYKRKRVRAVVDRFLPARSSILELNAGTGQDAIYFAEQGHTVHATDISRGMQEELLKKIEDKKIGAAVSFELCSFTKLEALQDPGPYDLVFSNFAGLNCTAELEKVLGSFPYLVKPGGLVVLVILPRFCLWEILLMFKGKLKTAFRRFSGRKGSKAKIDGKQFRCWYYNPSFIRHRLKDSFEVLALEGLCTLVPPSYIEYFAEKHPRLYNFLEKKENNWKDRWPWRSIGDYFIITLRKKG